MKGRLLEVQSKFYDSAKDGVVLSLPSCRPAFACSNASDITTSASTLPPGAFRFVSGEVLPSITIAYETYGTLNSDSSNAILVFHALSGSQHLAGINSSLQEYSRFWQSECHVGWWDEFVGQGKAFNTDEYFVICANFIGGCYGSSGPSSIDPNTDKPYGSRFPRITATDIVNSQVLLLRHLGIEKLCSVVGASLGGMLAMNLAVRFPDLTRSIITIASATKVSTLQRLSRYEQILAIEADPNFNGGDYYDGVPPNQGLSLARIIAHKAYVSLGMLESRAREQVKVCEDNGNWYRLNHSIESYMRYQGDKFIKRFDANTYLLIAEAWQKFNLLRDSGYSSLEELFHNLRHLKHLVFSIDSDVCFYPEEQATLVSHLKAANASCNYITVHSDKGHDAFLLEPELFAPYIQYELHKVGNN